MNETFPTITADELLPSLDDDSLFLLDVREPDEFDTWHIPGAHNVPLASVADRLSDLPGDTPIVTVCARGSRAQQASEILRANQIPSRVLEGGMGSWGLVMESVELTFDNTLVVQFRRRGKGCLSYLIGGTDGAIVIDPASDHSPYLALAADRHLTITHVLDTHLHADHVSGARALAEATGATLLLNPADPFTYEFTPIRDGLRIAVGEGVHLSVAAVTAPGHTEGSTVYQLGDDALFTGDTLFLESVGRPDLADEAEVFAHALYRSLHEIVLPLPDELLIFPAHFGPSVPVRFGELVTKPLGDLRGELPALAYDEDTFVAWAIGRITDRPDNYREIVRFNAGRSDRVLADVLELELGPNRCAIAS